MLKQIIQDIKTGENIDVLIAIVLAFFISIADLLGISLNEKMHTSFTIALLGMIAFLFLKQRHQINKIQQNLDKDVIFSNAGFVDLEDSLNFNLIKKGIEKSSKKIYILDNWICENLIALEPQIISALKRGVELKIAIMNPKSPLTEIRSKDLGKQSDYVKSQIQSNIDDLKKIREKSGHTNFELVLYSSLPSVELFIFDNEVILSNFLVGVESRYNPHIILKEQSDQGVIFGFSKCLLDNFFTVFKDGTRVF